MCGETEREWGVGQWKWTRSIIRKLRGRGVVVLGMGEGCEVFVWRKKTVEKVPKIIKKKNSRRKSPFRFPVRILIYFQNSDRCFLFATRVYYTRPMVYGRKFTTRMPFYNVAVIPRYIIVDRSFGRLDG